MNFHEMYHQVQEGLKARRPSWNKGEFLFWSSQRMLHNSPYTHQDKPVEDGAYYYVVEKDDPIAKDWEIIN